MMITGEVKTKKILLCHFPFRGRLEFPIPKYYKLEHQAEENLFGAFTIHSFVSYF